MNFDALHLITVKYHGETGNRSSRIGLSSYRFKSRIFIEYNHGLRSALDGALVHLVAAGFNVLGVAEQANSYAVITDTFKALK